LLRDASRSHRSLIESHSVEPATDTHIQELLPVCSRSLSCGYGHRKPPPSWGEHPLPRQSFRNKRTAHWYGDRFLPLLHCSWCRKRQRVCDLERLEPTRALTHPLFFETFRHFLQQLLLEASHGQRCLWEPRREQDASNRLSPERP